MNKTKSLFIPIALTALLLVGCKGAVITREEAVSRVADIEEHYASEDFTLPKKYSLTQEMKATLFDVAIEIKATENLDLDAKYYYMSMETTSSEESEYMKMWIYYQANANKTYMVTDANGTKSHVYAEGDLFGEAFDYGNSGVAEIYNLGLSDLVSDVVEEDERNVYRSSGEGSIYLKVFLSDEGADAYAEVEISKYLLVRVYSYIDENSEMEVNIKYSGVSTTKPNLADYPLAS